VLARIPRVKPTADGKASRKERTLIGNQWEVVKGEPPRRDGRTEDVGGENQQSSDRIDEKRKLEVRQEQAKVNDLSGQSIGANRSGLDAF